jgi:hypothetical protein
MFEDLPLDLQNDIHTAISKYPDTRQSFEKLYLHFTDQLPHKKKIRPTTIINDQVDLSSGTVIRDLSFSIPDRKKFNLVISSGSLSIVKDSVVVHAIRNSNVSGCLLLEIPDKLKKQYSVVIVDKTKQGEDQAFCQFTLTDIEADKMVAIPHGKQPKGKILDVLVNTLKSLDITIVHSSSLVVAAHRGSKEGLLYFLSDMIFFGFKKPLLIFRCYEIESISYSSITRLTFNLSIKLFNSAQEYEFSMIDQTNFDRINEYVTRYELNNQSMAESRRAKLYTKEQSANELQKAQEELPEKLPEEAAEQGKNGQVNNNDSDDEEDVNYEDSEDEDDSEPSSEEEGQDGDEGDEEDEDEDNDEEEDI